MAVGNKKLASPKKKQKAGIVLGDGVVITRVSFYAGDETVGVSVEVGDAEILYRLPEYSITDPELAVDEALRLLAQKLNDYLADPELN